MNMLLFPEEFDLQLQIGEELSLGLICTRDRLKELIYGFLFNEGLIVSASNVESIEIQGHVAKVTLNCIQHTLVPIQGTGFGGVLLSGTAPANRFPIDCRYSMESIRRFSSTMNEQAIYYKKTGGMHCSALCDSNNMLAVFEDIGRHNTIDKLAGHCLLEQIDAPDSLLITTGRISQDMVRKAARIGASVIASYSTPTQQAVQTAREATITLIRYLGKSCTLCTVPERIIF